jgi:hypothetical protein
MAEQRIDAIKMIRAIRDQNYGRLRNISRAERLAFYRKQARLMNAKAVALTKAETDARQAARSQ